MSPMVVVGRRRRRSSVVGMTSLELDVLGPVGRRRRLSSSVVDHGGHLFTTLARSGRAHTVIGWSVVIDRSSSVVVVGRRYDLT